MERIADRDEILVLTAAAREGHVPAMRLLLAELQRDQDDRTIAQMNSSVIDELAAERQRKAR